MMKRIVENTHGHPLKYQKFSKIDKVPLCTSCSLGKLIVRPSPLKIENESPIFLERIQGDICSPIHPPFGPFRYFMVLIDASIRWSHVSLLSTRNAAFAKFLAQIIKLMAHFPDYIVKRVRLDNAGELTSHAFNDYCISVRIVVEHLVSHVHTQNVYVPIAPPQRTKKGPQRRLGIYVGYKTSSIIRYVKPLMGDVFTACFADCHFNEAIFLPLGGKKKTNEKDVSWSEPSLLYLDPHTKQSETEYGNPPREGSKPFAVRPSTKLGQRSDLFKSNTHDLPLYQRFPAKVENVVIQDLTILQGSQELFDPIEA
ncbi:retrovirus-related pol polyprotein from transposon TNT 1-94 [Tanacetum coccineum]